MKRPIKSNTMSIGFVLVLICSLSACSHRPAVPVDTIAVWRGGTITTEDLESWLFFQGKTANPQDLAANCQDMALILALANETEELGVDAATTQTIENAVDALMIKRLRRHMGSQIKISDQEIEHAYLEFPEAFHRPRKLRLRNLFLSFPPGASEAEKETVRTNMLEIQRRLQKGEDFGDLAEQESHSQTRFQKGLMGNVSCGQLPPKIDKIAMLLGPGEISSVIEGPDGLTILNVERVIEARSPTPAEVRNGLATNLRHRVEKSQWEALALELGDGDSTGPTFKKAAAERARNLGLDRDPGTAATIRWIRRQHLATEALRRRVESAISIPTQGQVRHFFDANRGLFTSPETFDLAVIQLDISDKDLSTVHREAVKISYDLRNGRRDFAEAARIHSDDPSAPNGGRLPSMTRRQIAGRGPEFMKTVVGLEDGRISREFSANGSEWIVRLDARRPQQPLEFEQAADQARNRLTKKRVAQVQHAIDADIRTRLDVVILQ